MTFEICTELLGDDPVVQSNEVVDAITSLPGVDRVVCRSISADNRLMNMDVYVGKDGLQLFKQLYRRIRGALVGRDDLMLVRISYDVTDLVE